MERMENAAGLHHGIAREVVHEESDFGCWTLPVFFGERVKRKSGDMDSRGGFNGRPHGSDTRAMASDARHVTCRIKGKNAAAANLTRLPVAELSRAKDVSIFVEGDATRGLFR